MCAEAIDEGLVANIVLWFLSLPAALFVCLVRAAQVYDLRHTFASWYMMNRGDLYELAKILGHANIQDDRKIRQAWKGTYREDW